MKLGISVKNGVHLFPQKNIPEIAHKMHTNALKFPYNLQELVHYGYFWRKFFQNCHPHVASIAPLRT